MYPLQTCMIELREMASARYHDLCRLRSNGEIDQAQEAGEEMDALNSAIYFLKEYETTLNAFRIIRDKLALDKE